MKKLIPILKKHTSDIVSDLATALFSIPGGMAFAKLAGVHPIYGLYSGMVATVIQTAKEWIAAR